MEVSSTYWNDRALLEWQVELGVLDAVEDKPVNRYALEPKKPKPAPVAAKVAPTVQPQSKDTDAVAIAKQAATAANDISALAAAMSAFDQCELKKGAQKFVFADGEPAARVMIVGEAPGREEDRAGKPFVGQAGQLLDKMLAAIELDRSAPAPSNAVYITNVLPWRPPSNRTPDQTEIAMMLPFLQRHVDLGPLPSVTHGPIC